MITYTNEGGIAVEVAFDRQLLLEVFKLAVVDHARHHCWNERCTGQHLPCADDCFCREDSGEYGPYGRIAVAAETVQLVSIDPTSEYDLGHYGHDQLVAVRYTAGTGHDHHALYGVSTTTGDISLYAD